MAYQRRCAALQLSLLVIIQIVPQFASQVCLNPPNAYTCAGSERIPLAIPKLLVNPFQLNGTWFEYMVINPEISYSNRIIYYTPISPILSGVFTGTSTNPNQTLSGAFMNFTDTFYSQPGKECLQNFDVTNFGNDGRQTTFALLAAFNVNHAVFLYIDILYTDYTSVLIQSLCLSRNYATGVCDKPSISVLTRQNPSQLSQASQTSLKAAVNSALNPYCLTADQLTITPWDDYLPICSIPAPAPYAQLLQLLTNIFSTPVSTMG